MNVNSKNIKIKVSNLYKIFGNYPYKAFDYIEKGFSKNQIMEETGSIVGSKDINFEVRRRYVSFGNSNRICKQQPRHNRRMDGRVRRIIYSPTRY